LARLAISILIIDLLFWCQAGQAADIDGSKKTFDGRFGTECYSLGLHLDRKGTSICDVSIYRLLARPESYHGRNVRTVGFLVRFLGQEVLFPNRLSYETLNSKDGFLVDGLIPDRVGKFLERGAWPVLVIGRMDAKNTGADTEFAGRISDIITVDFQK
jgi:hypothetical protein